MPARPAGCSRRSLRINWVRSTPHRYRRVEPAEGSWSKRISGGKLIKIGSACRALVALGLMLGPTASAQDEEIKWGTSYRDGKKLAKEGDRLMMLDFWADW